MNLIAAMPTLIAQFSKWKRMGDGFRRGSPHGGLSDLLPYLLATVLVGVGVWAFLHFRKKRDLSLPCNDPEKLFRELSLAHHLDKANQKILWQLAQAFNLAQPAEVFITPQIFAPQNLPEQLQAEAERIAELRQRLF